MVGLSRALVLALLALTNGQEEPSTGYGPAYLVYAGPYSASPSSAFGHLFLALADAPGQPPPLWRVVTFNAETFGANPIRFVTVGIAGGFLGRFTEVPFHEKTREYGVLDDRDLWLLELSLSPAERRALEAAILGERGRWHPYTFFSRNCAYYLHELLARVTGAVEPPSGRLSPVDVLQEVGRSRIGGTNWFRPSASGRIRTEAEGMFRPETNARVSDADWQSLAADTSWQDSLSAAERGVLTRYFGLRQATTRTRLAPAVSHGIERLRVAGLDGASNFQASVDPGIMPIERPEFHRYSRLRLLVVADEGRAGRVAVAMRGAMHDESDPWDGNRPLNSLALLELRLSSTVDALDLRLDEVIVFAQRALVPEDWVRDRSSWMLEVRGGRGGVLSEDGFHAEVRAGNGMTRALPGGTFAYGLVTVAAVGQWGRGLALAPGVEFGLVNLGLQRFRWGVRWTHERDVADWSAEWDRLRAWARLDVGRRQGVFGAWALRGGTQEWSLGIDWYP